MRLPSIRRRFDNWMQFRRLSPVARQVHAEKKTYLSVRKLVRLEAAQAEIDDARVPGDIIEFGIALGGSTVLLARQAARGRSFFGLDVFGMIPSPNPDKDDVKSLERYRTIASGAATGIGGDVYYGYHGDLYRQVSELLARHGTPVNGITVNLVKGLFQDTLPALELRTLALAHVDCDWYDPVRFCLEETARRMPVGGVIIVDDYNDYAGCRLAVDEFLATHREFEFDAGPNPILRRVR